MFKSFQIVLLAISIFNGSMLTVKQEQPLESEFGLNLIVTRPQSEVTPDDVHYLISYYAREYKIDEKLLSRIIYCESSFNPLAKNKSSTAGGLGGFIDSTFVSARKQMGEPTDLWLKYDKEEAVKTTAFYISKNGVGAWSASYECQKSLLTN